MMTDNPANPLVEALLSALTLDWSDNGNLSAEAIRDSCITILAETLGKSFDDVLEIIDHRIEESQ